MRARAKPRTSKVGVAAVVKGETAEAWQLSDGVRSAWVPKSQITVVNGTFEMPEWLAKAKGFL